MRKHFLLLLTLLCLALSGRAAEQFVSFQKEAGGFCLAENGEMAAVVNLSTDQGIEMAIESLREDILEVSGTSNLNFGMVYVGTVADKGLAEALQREGIDLSLLEGKREKYLIVCPSQTPDQPMLQKLFIAGSDKRGAIYGIYELSRQMGVSPWQWWMDVPCEKHPEIYIRPGVYTDGEPAVEYRGIFINDEWPCFGEWSNEQFGGQNSKLYKRIFELLLRLKGNFMWPAMWNNAFWDDDPDNGRLANTMGIVMSTSHHEPMNLAQQDWKRRGGTEKQWNYVTNEQGLRDFWRTGIRRSKDWETIITIGMRGDGDMEMPSAADNRALLERIVRDQRQIISEEMGRPAEEVPQVWALYKEVQDYYDQGMRVPDDVTLLFCDDNWGNVRRIPTPEMRNRKGGFGMYYHFDYVGDPRNSKWINISPISRVWEQMNLCYESGIRKIWVVNVGDLKPMEYPIQFFLDMAWNPKRFRPDNLIQHTDSFCTSIFGEEYGREASYLLRTYPLYNRRITLENLNKDTYSFWHGSEWGRVNGEYNRLRMWARQLEEKLPDSLQAAYFQLLGMPIEGCANLYNMYFAQAANSVLYRSLPHVAHTRGDRKTYGKQVDRYAKIVSQCYERDSLLTLRWDTISGGKWRHLMDEKRIGYTYWQTPDKRVMPEIWLAGKRLPKEYIPWEEIEEKGCRQQMRMPLGGTKTAPPVCFHTRLGYASIEAEHYQRSTSGDSAHWTVIPEMGRTLSGLTTLPVLSPTDGCSVEYDFTCTGHDSVTVMLRLSATLNYIPEGHRIALSIDGSEEQVININGHYRGELGKWQLDHVIDISARFALKEQEMMHTLRVRPLMGGIVMQKIVLDLGGLQPSHLWPMETEESTAEATYTWACAPTFVEPKDMPKSGLAGNSVRQIIPLSAGGETLILRLSNVHGDTPLDIRSVYVAPVDSSSSAIDSNQAHNLSFLGKRGCTLQPGFGCASDIIRIHLEPGQLLSVTICYGDRIPEQLTGHPGSRTTSYIVSGEATPSTDFSGAERAVCWYTLADAITFTDSHISIPMLGNSITDGRGSTTDRQNRLTDAANGLLLPHDLSLLNFGIGGNCLTMRCLGPSGHDRLEKDVIHHLNYQQPAIVFLGVNDIGNSSDTAATYQAMCNEYQRIASSIHNAGSKAIACTILPFKGHYYYTPEHEALRQRINRFIREEAGFDAVIDADAYMADPNDPEQLRPEWHDGDWLHPNALGHKLLGEYIARELLKILQK
ncbi:MAG: glycosyl hydrolase 115 family protein [Bacteroidales bacterium]|nr:glycosyl hydrolase 115 family protein [Candidatus Colicola faecequi]